ncbi:MAG: MBL fold metallo-hydrolase [Opitutaceae bacterium]|nr:MBL fold metallo-hydrolase [Opitutaceae bacterium]
MIPLEDTVGDIIGKAQKGLGLLNEVLAERAGITPVQLRSLKGGSLRDPGMLRRVAAALKLGGDALVASAEAAWHPEQPALPAGFRAFNTPFNGMTVNAYLVWDTASRHAVLFDTGADAAPVLAALKAEKLQLQLILITHAHIDHVMELPRLVEATGAKAWINVRDRDEEDFPKTVETFSAGQSFIVGGLRIESRLTSGHSAGQTTYVVRGLSQPLAVVGDSLFAGSMGGGVISYADQLRNNREQILTLPDATILACGHGPLTTVGQEKKHNPFFTG